VFLFRYSPLAWYFAIGWIVIGLLAYYTYVAKKEALEKPKEILLEEVLVSTDYSVLVPVATQEQARILGRIGAILAKANRGEVLALHVVRVPPQLTLGEGRLLLKEGRPLLETVIQEAKKLSAPVHTMIRLGRDVPEAIRKTSLENASDLILLGWPGYTRTSGRIYGSVIDPIVDNPPVDIAVVRYRHRRPVRKVLVPVAGGSNSRRAVKMAVTMAAAGEDGPASVTLLYVVPHAAGTAARVRGKQVFRYIQEGMSYEHMETRIVEGENLIETIVSEAKDYDLVVVGATEEPLFRNLLLGNVAEQIARRVDVTAIVVKRRSSRLHSFLRETVLEPSTEAEETPEAA